MSPSAASGTLPRASSVLAEATSIRWLPAGFCQPPPMNSDSCV